MTERVRYFVKVNSRGGITIPAQLRRECGIVGKTDIIVGERDGRIVIEPAPGDGSIRLRGRLAPWSLWLKLIEDSPPAQE